MSSNNRVYTEELMRQWVDQVTTTVNANGVIYPTVTVTATTGTASTYVTISPTTVYTSDTVYVGNSGALGEPGPVGLPGLLPMAMKIAASTIAMDLVAVTPMSAPSGLLTYIDMRGKRKFRIFYVSVSGEEKEAVVEGFSLDDAASKVEDLGEINFHMDYGPIEA